MSITEDRVHTVLPSILGSKNPKLGKTRFNKNMFLESKLNDSGDMIEIRLTLHSTVIVTIFSPKVFSIDGIKIFSIFLDSGGYDTRTTSRYMTAVLQSLSHTPFYTCLRKHQLCLYYIGAENFPFRGLSFRRAMISLLATRRDPCYSLHHVIIDGIDYEIPQS